MSKILTALVLAGVCTVLSAKQFRVEATGFPKKSGTWQVGKSAANTNNEYYTSMGKHSKLGGSFVVPTGGKYTIWAYTMTMHQGTRQCTLYVNGKKHGMFGDAINPSLSVNNGWYFEKVGEAVDLTAGKVQLLIDGEGGYGRIDFLIFTDDASFIPSGTRKDWEAIEEAECAPTTATGLATFRLEATAFANKEGKFQKNLLACNTNNESLVLQDKSGSLKDSFIAPSAGTYTVWAYTMTLKQGGRRFNVVVNDQKLGTFGDSKEPGPSLNAKGWYFEKLPNTVTLPAGKFNVSIISNGGWGRVDFLIFSNDPTFSPGATRQDWENILEAERAPESAGAPSANP